MITDKENRFVGSGYVLHSGNMKFSSGLLNES